MSCYEMLRVICKRNALIQNKVWIPFKQYPTTSVSVSMFQYFILKTKRHTVLQLLAPFGTRGLPAHCTQNESVSIQDKKRNHSALSFPFRVQGFFFLELQGVEKLILGRGNQHWCLQEIEYGILVIEDRY